MKQKRIAALLLALLLALLCAACGSVEPASGSDSQEARTDSPASDSGVAAQVEEPGELTLIEEAAPADEAEKQVAQPAEDMPEESTESGAEEDPAEQAEALLPEDGSYTTAEDVALYIHQYGHLPGNFMTKKEAQALGWSGGSLEPYAPGMCIGGSRFGNYEGLLPEKEGRVYTECDIDTLGANSRGAKRIVFSNDGLIYYTDDHYESFTLLYGEEEA